MDFRLPPMVSIIGRSLDFPAIGLVKDVDRRLRAYLAGLPRRLWPMHDHDAVSQFLDPENPLRWRMDDEHV